MRLGDSQDYELVKEKLYDESGEYRGFIWVLTKEGKATFLAKMKKKQGEKRDATLIELASIRLQATSKDVAVTVTLIRPLSDNDGIYAFELRPNPRKSTIRVMVYLHHDDTRQAVLLFPFEGHKKKSAGIDPKHLDKAKRLAGIARSLCEQKQRLKFIDTPM